MGVLSSSLHPSLNHPLASISLPFQAYPFFIWASTGASVWYCVVWFSCHDYNLSLLFILKTEDRVLRFLATK